MKVYSIFNSIDGEVNAFHQGAFTTFIRFSGCNLQCSYCDTKYAQDYGSGKEMSVYEIIEEVKKIGCEKVTLTGGEPLLQPSTPELIEVLLTSGYSVSVETNGTIAPPYFDEGRKINWVMDWKLPNSGMSEYMKRVNFLGLWGTDFVKFVIRNRKDYEAAVTERFRLLSVGCFAKFAFSPVHNVLDPAELIEWMKEDKLFDVIVNLQIHKYIWGECPGREV